MRIPEGGKPIKSPNYYRLLFLLLLFSFFSCNNDKNTEYSHPEYFDYLFTTAEKILDTNPNYAVKFLDSTFNTFPHPGIKDLYRKYALKYTYFLNVQGNSDKAMVYADSMLWVIRDHVSEKDFIEDYGNALFKKGELLMWKRDYAGALECDYKARECIQKTKDTCLLSSYTSMLGIISYKQGKYLDAAHYKIQVIKELLQCNNKYGNFQKTQALLDDIGIAYGRSGMPDSGLYYFNTALNYLDENKDKFPNIKSSGQFVEIAKGVVYGNMGDIYCKQGDTATGEKFYEKGFEINSRPGYDHGDAQCTGLKIVNLDLVRKHFPEANTALSKLRNSLDSFPEKDNELKWYTLQLDYLEKTGQTDFAYKYVKPFLKLKDSFASIKPIPQFDIREQYEHIKNEYDLVVLEKKDAQKNYYLIIVLICTFVSIVLALVLWFDWKRHKKLNNEIIKQNNEMQLALTSLTDSEKRNTQLMQIVAHDLRNPIASMYSIISILLDSPELVADDKEMLELMQTSCSHSIQMIGDIMNMNTTAEGMTKEPAEVHTLLRYCVDLLQFKATDKKQRITLTTDEATLVVNREKIWRVISNLIVNAIKFSPQGAEINIYGKKNEHDFLIVVQDHGIGIPETIKERVFDMFTEAKRPGTSGEQSFGLGLAISRQIIVAHGGKIWLESESGVGTKFFISLPIS